MVKKASDNVTLLDQEILKEIDNGGCGDKCKEKKNLLKTAKTEKKDSYTKLLLARKKSDSIVTTQSMPRVVANWSRLSEEDIKSLYPFCLPLGLWILGIVLPLLCQRPMPSIKNNTILPESLQILNWLQQTGFSQRQAAEHFNLSEATISRRVSKAKTMKSSERVRN